MSDRDRAELALSDAIERVEDARRELSTLQLDGEAADSKAERRAVERTLRELAERLRELLGLISEPDASESTPERGSDRADDGEPDDSESSGDLFSLEDQHAVSMLMQDTAVHLAVRREPGFWEIRHRHTADGQPSEPLRAATIADAYELYRRHAVRRGSPRTLEPRALTADEQRALATLRDLATDNPRAVRWEATKTEVDYVDRDGEIAGGKHDAVEFPRGELIGPIEHLEKMLG